MSYDEQPLIAAISPALEGIRVAVTDGRDRLLDGLEVSPGQTRRLLRFLARQHNCCQDLEVVGCLHDPWPPGLPWQIESVGFQCHWFSPTVFHTMMRYLEPWNRLRRIHQARTLAHLYRIHLEPWNVPQPLTVVRRWEYQAAMGIIDHPCNQFE